MRINRKIKYLLGTSIFALMLLLGWTSAAMAVVPSTINYQGHLTDAAGAPVNGTTNIFFALYTASTGGIAIWSETHIGVQVTKNLEKRS